MTVAATTTSLTPVGSFQRTFVDQVSIIGLFLKDATVNLQNSVAAASATTSSLQS
jgi:hypothetical protein